MMSDLILSHPRLIAILVGGSFEILDVSIAAEEALGRSKVHVQGNSIWQFIEKDQALEGALTRPHNTTIFDHEIRSIFHGVIRGDIHTQIKGDQKLVWIYHLGRNIQLERSDATRSVAKLASGMAAMFAHEIRNPLSSIQGASQLLWDSVNADDQSLLEVISEESRRIDRLVSEFEEMAGSAPVHIQPVNIHLILDQVKRAALAGYGRGITFEENYDPSLPDVACDSDRMLRALHNIIKNACEAITTHFGTQMKNGRILLQTRYRTGIRRNHGALPVEILIQDNGGGVPPEILDDLFKPFFTSKAKGTGLGLSIVARTIDDIGAAIEVTSQKDTTSMRIYTPVFSEGSE